MLDSGHLALAAAYAAATVAAGYLLVRVGLALGGRGDFGAHQVTSRHGGDAVSAGAGSRSALLGG